MLFLDFFPSLKSHLLDANGPNYSHTSLHRSETLPRGYKTFGDQSQTHGEYVPESEFITEVIKRLRSFSCSTLSLTLSSKRHNLEQAPALAQRQSRNQKWPRTSDKNADEDKF